VFSVSVLHDERIVVVAEQRPDASEEDSFQWMSRVLQVLTVLHILLLVDRELDNTCRFAVIIVVNGNQVCLVNITRYFPQYVTRL